MGVDYCSYCGVSDSYEFIRSDNWVFVAKSKFLLQHLVQNKNSSHVLNLNFETSAIKNRRHSAIVACHEFQELVNHTTKNDVM